MRNVYGSMILSAARAVWALIQRQRRSCLVAGNYPKNTTYCVTIVPEGEDPFGMNVTRFQYRRPPRNENGEILPPLIFEGGDADREQEQAEKS